MGSLLEAAAAEASLLLLDVVEDAAAAPLPAGVVTSAIAVLLESAELAAVAVSVEEAAVMIGAATEL